MDKELADSYIAADYEKTAKLLEQQITQLAEKGAKDERVSRSDLYQKRLFLGYIYAWKLNKPEAAVKEYQKAAESRQSSEEARRSPPFELLFIAEIYEMKKDLSKAREYYRNFLNELTATQEKESDDISILMAEELTKFVKYQIDGINLKEKPVEQFTLLLPKLKLSSSMTSSAIFPFLIMIIVPTAQYDFAIASKADLADYIKQSPPDLNYSLLNYMLIINASASMIDESSEKAMRAYIAKYPESYNALLLEYMFYKFYKENEQKEKAKELLGELKKVAQKRGMEIITEPDKRFSSPEKTWEIYKKAFLEGDIDTMIECYVPGGGKIVRAFREIGKEKMKEIGKDMGDIKQINANKESATYEILRKEGDKVYSYELKFHNIDGEWKMYDF